MGNSLENRDARHRSENNSCIKEIAETQLGHYFDVRNNFTNAQGDHSLCSSYLSGKSKKGHKRKKEDTNSRQSGWLTPLNYDRSFHLDSDCLSVKEIFNNQDYFEEEKSISKYFKNVIDDNPSIDMSLEDLNKELQNFQSERETLTTITELSRKDKTDKKELKKRMKDSNHINAILEEDLSEYDIGRDETLSTCSSREFISQKNNKQHSKRSGNSEFLNDKFIIKKPGLKFICYKFWITASIENWKAFHNPLDRRIESIGRLSDCRIRLTSITRRSSAGLPAQEVHIYAPTIATLKKCCNLFDDKFPHFYASSNLQKSFHNNTQQTVYLDEITE